MLSTTLRCNKRSNHGAGSLVLTEKALVSWACVCVSDVVHTAPKTRVTRAQEEACSDWDHAVPG